MTADLVAFLRARLDEDEQTARAASGGTMIGEPGNWQPSPTGDEWEACQSDGDEELLVALRPGLPRPPDVMTGLWGAVFSAEPDDSDPEAWAPMPRFKHAARHDPARVLLEVEAKRLRLDEIDRAIKAGHDSYDLASILLPLEALPYATHPDYRPEWAPDA